MPDKTEKEKQYIIAGQRLLVHFELQLVRIVNSDALKLAIASNPESVTAELITSIQNDYYAYQGKRLAITYPSFTVEIWGHLYFEQLLLKYGSFFRFVLRRRFFDRLRRSCEVIDCGEAEKDPNRRVWDLLGWSRRFMIRRLRSNGKRVQQNT
jgi:hypothetical protein